MIFTSTITANWIFERDKLEMSGRQFLDNHITEAYGSVAECPWASAPSYGVYRHNHNKKWFAVIMTIDKSKLSILGGGQINVVNLKCEPIILNSALNERGFYPAYHMNKEHWITVALDGTVSEEKIKFFLSLSHELTL